MTFKFEKKKISNLTDLEKECQLKLKQTKMNKECQEENRII